MRSLELFEEAPACTEPALSVEEMLDRAVQAILQLMRDGHPIAPAYSGGKDSSLVCAVALQAAVLAKEEGIGPLLIHVVTSDTLVESPEVASHYRSELRKMEAFGRKHGIPVSTKVVTPNLLSTFQVKVLTGRGLPSFQTGSSDCSTDLKLTPSRVYRNQWFAKVKDAGWKEPVTLLGTRFDESARRARKMALRGEHTEIPVRNKDGQLILSPLADFNSDDVWEALALYGAGVRPSYSDFEETKRLYATAAGTSCAVVAEAIMEGVARKKGGCGSRFGCHTCQVAEDKSMRNMLEHEQYQYMRGLYNLNRLIRNTRYDWSKRHYIGRTIQAGWIAIEPDTYSPAFIRLLTRLMIQIDFDEETRARNAGEAPRFQLLPFDMLLAIDAMQSLNGIAVPFSCLADWRNIRYRGVRYEWPAEALTDDARFSHSHPMPETKFLFVGGEWDDSAQAREWSGLRDPFHESLTADSACGPELVETNGKLTWKAETGERFSVDPESAWLIEEFELDRLADRAEAPCFIGGVTDGYRWYRQYGCLNLSYSQQKEHDEICRRTDFKERLGLTLDCDVEQLVSRAVPYFDLPAAAQAVWKNKLGRVSVQPILWAA